MPRIRVLVSNQPRLMRDLVIAMIANQRDIEVIAESPSESEIAEAVDRCKPDFLIMTLENPEVQPVLCGFLLGRYPLMKIVAITGEGSASVCYWSFASIRSAPIDASKQGLLETLYGRLEPALEQR